MLSRALRSHFSQVKYHCRGPDGRGSGEPEPHHASDSADVRQRDQQWTGRRGSPLGAVIGAAEPLDRLVLNSVYETPRNLFHQ